MLRLLLIFWTIVFSWLSAVLGVIAFFIAVIVDYSKSIFFGLSRTCYIDIASGSIGICFFLGLVLTTAMLSVFLIFFIRGLSSIFQVQRVIGGLKSLWSWVLAGFWGWDLGFIWLLVLDMASLGVDWPISIVTTLLYIAYNEKGL